MTARDLGRLAVLLSRLGARDKGNRAIPGVSERTEQSGLGQVTYDVYSPYGEKDSLRTIIVVHGLTFAGRKDVRLIHFARCLAQSNITCVVPTLPGLSKGKLETEDIDRLELAVQIAVKISGTAVGIIGFSYGGSYGLVSASRPSIVRHINYVLSIGAYHSLGEVFESYVDRAEEQPRNEEEWDNLIYLNVVMSYQNPSVLRQPEKDWKTVGDLFERYCHRASIAEKKKFYFEHLKERNIIGQSAAILDDRVLDTLSPKGKLDSLACRVSVLHDENDTLVHSSHAQAIFDELARSGKNREHRLLISTMLSHIYPKHLLEVQSLRKLYAAVQPIVSAY